MRIAWLAAAVLGGIVVALGVFACPARADSSDDAVRLDIARQIEATRSDASYMQLFHATLRPKV